MRPEWNSLILLLVAVMNAVTLYYTRKTEKNTNSMKDALVAQTALASHAAGRKEGVKVGAAEQRERDK